MVRAEIKRGEPREPTPEQQTFAQVDFFLSLHDTLSKVSKKYVEARPNWNDLKPKQQKRLQFLFLDGLLDEYIINRYGDESDQAAGLHQNRFTDFERDTYQNLLATDNLMELLNGREELYQKDAANYTDGDIRNVLINATLKLRKFSNEQSGILFGEAGYTSNQHIGEKIGVAAKDTALLGGLALATEPIGGAIGAAITPDNFGDISDPTTLVSVGASYALHYGLAVYNAWQNHQLLKNQDINTCPNLWSTSLYLLLQKYHPKLAATAVYAGTIVPTLLQEFVVGPLLLLPGGGAIVLGRNLVGSSIFGGVAAFMKSEIGQRHLLGGR